PGQPDERARRARDVAVRGRGRCRADPGQARARDRGRPDAHPRRDDLRRGRTGREAARRVRARRSATVRRGDNRRDLRAVSERRHAPPRYGLRAEADGRPARDDRTLGRGPRPDRNADRPPAADRSRQAGAARDVQAPGDGRADAQRRPRREGPAGTSARVSATVVALGGNALMRPGERGTAAEQLTNLRRAMRSLQPLLVQPGLVLTHGNGPQVGNELIRQERAADEAPPLPLWLAVAQTQAEIGALIAAELRTYTTAACLLTHVRVAADDPAFDRPTKPIGPFYSPEQAEQLERERGWAMVSDANRGHRRVVPSPQPL